MFTKNNLEKTIYLSLGAQIITSAISFKGINYNLEQNDQILQDILKLELFVQLVEFIFYVWIATSLKNYDTMTSRRYIDWIITTPTMLFSTIIFMKYQEQKEKNDNHLLTLEGFINDNKSIIKKIFFYNGLMLYFGYLGESKQMDLYKSVTIGFVFFYLSFNTIYKEYAQKSKEGEQLFNFLLIVWGLYGVAAIMDPIKKNILYNILDVIAKNFYGLFIYFKIKNIKTQQPFSLDQSR